MPHELLEEIRLLGNIETATTKLLNIVLCGQPELADRLNDASLRQLKQRVALRCELRPLTLDETAAVHLGPSPHCRRLARRHLHARSGCGDSSCLGRHSAAR